VPKEDKKPWLRRVRAGVVNYYLIESWFSFNL
jgi:hypothetical protein